MHHKIKQFMFEAKVPCSSITVFSIRYLTNREALSVLRSVVKHVGSGQLEHERSVEGNTRRSRVFLLTSPYL